MNIPFRTFSIKNKQRISLFSFVSRNSMLEKNIAIKRFCKLKNITIGKYSYIANNTHIINCKIGNYCSIGPSVKIGLGKHPTNRFSTSPLFYSLNNPFRIKLVDKEDFEEFEEIIIGHDVWIGANAIILDGVKIGNGAIIAAGAIVTKDVSAYSIVGGTPAKVLKYRFSNEVVERIIQSNWWEKDIKDLSKYKDSFSNINLFLEKSNNLNEEIFND
ncbi:CatB-related O-acetyltransferase [Rossellomorea sp. NPDC071047]|jgi:acetyltransferase-like isoleucine patch superfamily enzyme|uniref:CatB-related O-acetyltransferase n=1 Tax=Rossellomorea sp. NPDC071047 TaxID=3390675 RepID=UPI003CFE6DEA